MRRFRFVGDPENYLTEGDDFLLSKNDIYDGNFIRQNWNSNVEEYAKKGRYSSKDWQEVFEEPKLHQTDLGYYSGEFLKSVFSNPECSKDSRSQAMSSELIVKWAIDISKELIKQLKEDAV